MIINATKTLHLLFFLCILTQTPSFGQSGKIFRARNQTVRGNFDKATYLYQKALEKDSLNYKANMDLGKIYLNQLQVFDSAEFYIERAIQHPNKEPNYVDYYEYANAKRLVGKPIEALKQYDLFQSGYLDAKEIREPGIDSILTVYRNYCKQNQELKKNPNGMISVWNMDFYINSSESEYTAVYFEEDSALMFNARYRDLKSEKQFADFMYMENIYYFDLLEAVSSTYDEAIEQESHQAIVSRIGNTDSLFVFYQNKLWQTKLENGRLSALSPLQENLSDYYFQPHGVISRSGKTFVFSAKKSIQDNLDLYSSSLGSDGVWSAPIKLPGQVNSDQDEDSPFLMPNDSILYFSSKGHSSSGKYDVFKSFLTAEGWSKPEIMPYPINSPGDDIYFSLNDDGKYGYLSSNRSGGLGLMDIYNIRMTPVPTFDCPNYENPPFVVTLDISESIDTSSVDLSYTWRFEDGETLKGLKVQKDLKTPGTHRVAIDIQDIVAGQIEKEEVIETIVIDSVNYIGFKSNTNYLVNEAIELDASVSYQEGFVPTNHFWAINDSILNVDNPILKLDSLSEGAYAISVQIYCTQGGILESYCRTDSIYVQKMPTENTLDTNLFASDPQGDPTKFIDTTSTVIIDPSGLDSLIKENPVVDDLSINPIYFKFDRSNLKKSSTVELDRLIDYLEKYPNISVIITGHTDAMGSEAYNMILATQRINSTIAYLKSKGVKQSRIVQTISKGESSPVVSNTNPDGSDNSEGRKRNRRVEFILIQNK